ncbi:MAG TPA: hypothetical protein VER08_08410 [Pyrinomonadaceae bacterium]|nr:hypothetical protein [Pyrinomonadaceae bacterium]
MNVELLREKFAAMGARLVLAEAGARGRGRAGLDIKTDSRGEFFDIRVNPDEAVEYEVVDLRAEMQHLLLMSRQGEEKEKFLCGHDERHWFVCAVPGASVSSVTDAMAALQPPEVRRAVARQLKRAKNRFRRRNEAFVRQGEWFFIPVRDRRPFAPRLILRNEPLSRGGGSKPHVCEELARNGGELVYVCAQRPNGVTAAQYRKLLDGNAKARGWNWRAMRRDMSVFVRGRVRHADHKTVVLRGWHRVVMNTEREAPAMRHVVFLD